MLDIKLKEGTAHSIQKKVNDATGITFGRKGTDTLLSTTALTRMMIDAAVGLVEGNIPEGFITVVKKMEIYHEKPTLQGMTVTVKASLEEIRGHVLVFSMSCCDDAGPIAYGYQERYIVNKDSLIKTAHKRALDSEETN